MNKSSYKKSQQRLLLLLLLTSSTTERLYPFYYYGCASVWMTLCMRNSNVEIFSGFLNKAKKLSFEVNPNDPQRKHFIENREISGKYEYQMLPRNSAGAECYTIAGDRHQFIGLIFQKKDQENCYSSHYLLPKELSRCENGKSYTRVEDLFRFSNGQNLDSFESRRGVSFDLRSYNVANNFVWVHSPTDLELTDINSELFELFVLHSKYLIWKETSWGIYNQRRFEDFKAGLMLAGVQPTANEFFKSITHDSLPGLFLSPGMNGGPTPPQKSLFAERNQVYQLGISHTLTFHFFLTKISTVLQQTDIKLQINLNLRKSPQIITIVKELGYKLILKRGSSLDDKKIDFDLVRFENGREANTLSAQIEISSPNNWLHFGFIYGNGVLYYIDDSNVRYKTYETIFLANDPDNRRIKTIWFEHNGPLSLILNPLDDRRSYLMWTLISISNYLNNNQQTDQDLFGFRVHNTDYFPGAIPPNVIFEVEQDKYDKRCIITSSDFRRCLIHAFLWSSSDKQTSEYHFGTSAYRKSESCLSTECRACFFEDNCLVPISDLYNRPLFTNTALSERIPLRKLADFEGDSLEAVALRNSHVRFVDNLGKTYWIKCPENCQSCDIEMRCLSCPDDSEPVDGKCICSIPECERCEGPQKCGSCRYTKLMQPKKTNPEEVSCVNRCSEGATVKDASKKECVYCTLENCKRCYLGPSGPQCFECQNLGDGVMRWGDSEYHKNQGLPPEECIDRNTKVDGHYLDRYDFRKCPIKNCKVCPISQPQRLCDACADPENPNKKLYVDKASSDNQCIETCPKEEYKYINKEDHCVNCPVFENCKECDLVGCSLCKQGFGFKKGTRTCIECSGPGKLINDNKECDECLENCEKCLNTENCQKCFQGFYLLVSATGQGLGQCVRCNQKNQILNVFGQCKIRICQEGCLECDTDNLNKCRRCATSNEQGFLFLKVDQSGCSNQCPESYYKDKRSRTCLKCPENCINCNKEDGKCLECAPRYNLTSINTCIICEKTGKYIDLLGRCRDCSNESNCDRCQINPPNDCSSCLQAHVLIHSKCYKIKPLIPFKKEYESETNEIKLSFSAPLNKKFEQIVDLKEFITVQITSGSQNQTDFQPQITKIAILGVHKDPSKTILNLKLKQFNETFLKGTATITFSQPHIINRTKKEYAQLAKSTIAVYPIEKLTPQQESISKSLGVTSSIFSGFSLLMMIFSFKSSMEMSKTYQMFDFLFLLNVVKPSGLELFLSKFGQGDLSRASPPKSEGSGGAFSKRHCDRDGTNEIQIEDRACEIMPNVDLMLIMIGIVLVLRIFLEGVGYILKKVKLKENGYKKYRDWIEDKFGRKTLFFILSGNHINIYFYSFVHMRYNKSISQKFAGLMLLSIVLLISTISTLAYFAYVNTFVIKAKSRGEESVQDSFKAYLFLSEGVSYNNHFGRYFNLYRIFKDPLIAASVVFLDGLPALQILCTLVVMASLTTLILKFPPLELKIERWAVAFSSASFTVLNLTCFIQIIFGVSETSIVGTYIFGAICLVCIAFIILSRVVPACVKGYEAMKRFCTKKKNLSKIEQEQIEKAKNPKRRHNDAQKKFHGKLKKFEQNQQGNHDLDEEEEEKYPEGYDVHFAPNPPKAPAQKKKNRRSGLSDESEFIEFNPIEDSSIKNKNIKEKGRQALGSEANDFGIGFHRKNQKKPGTKKNKTSRIVKGPQSAIDKRRDERFRKIKQINQLKLKQLH